MHDDIDIVCRADKPVKGDSDTAHNREVNAGAREFDQQFFELEKVLLLGWRHGHICK